jgi:hypothetical protein
MNKEDRQLAEGVNRSNHEIVVMVIRAIAYLSFLYIGGSLIVVMCCAAFHLNMPAILTNILSAIVGGGLNMSGALGSFLVKTSPGPAALPAVQIDQPKDNPIPTSDSGPTPGTPVSTSGDTATPERGEEGAVS